MRKISKAYAKLKNLKMTNTINEDDMSKAILKMNRIMENKEVKYYTLDIIVFNQETNKGKIKISFWAD